MPPFSDYGVKDAQAESANVHDSERMTNDDLTPRREGPAFVSDEIKHLTSALGDRYRIEAEVGRGGMAIVFRAQDLKHGRTVAIKVLSPDLSATIGAERFEREIKIAARLQHPHILTVHDSGEAGGLLYYVMPFVVGESLRARLDREHQLPIEDAVELARDVADALEYAHGEGVVHRDIKPENILLASGHAVIADFGIARAANQSGDKVTKTGTAVGTVTYMSPEQFAGDSVDLRGDIYALGCVLYEMLVGEPPFTGSTPMIIMARHSMQEVPSIRMVRPSVPVPIEAAVARALAKVPADRFPTMGDFKRALEGDHSFTASWIRTAQHATTPYPPGKRLSAGWRSRSRWVTLGALAGLGLGVAIAANAAFTFSRRADAPSNANKIAVMYFENQSQSETLRSLGDALTESIIDQLAVVPGLDVVSRAGVDPYRGRGLVEDSIPHIADQLRVGSIVRGRIEPDADGVRIEVALLDATGRQWDQRTFERTSTNLLAVRDTVAEQVAEFLRQRLGKEFTLRASRSRANNPDAWLLGQRAERRRKDAERLLADSAAIALNALREADSLLAAAEELDPRWPDAPAGRSELARIRARALRGNRDAARAAVDTGVRHADRALELDPRHADALEARGSLRYFLITARLADEKEVAGVLDAAEHDLIESVRWQPSQATSWVTLSSLYYHKLDLAEAKNAAVRAYDADAWLRAPDLILPRLFWTNYDLEIFTEAKRWCMEGHARFPERPFFYECQLWLQTAPKGIPADPELAWSLKDSLVTRSPERLRAFEERKGKILVAGALARANLADSARHVLLQAREGARDVDPALELVGFEAIVRVMLNDHAEAVRLLKEYLTRHPDHRRGFAHSTGWWWRDLQTNPEFRKLVGLS
jgi:TolB-like protein